MCGLAGYIGVSKNKKISVNTYLHFPDLAGRVGSWDGACSTQLGVTMVPRVMKVVEQIRPTLSC